VKDFGKLSTEQLREFIGRVPELRLAFEDLRLHLASLNAARLDEILVKNFNWSAVYEIPFHEHLAFSTVALGLNGYLSEVAASADPQQRLLDDFDADLIESHNPAFARQDVVGLVVSLSKTVSSLMTHGRSLSALVADVRERGDLDALFEVVRIDRAAIACPSIADRVARAELIGDAAFFKRLRSAINGPSKKYWAGSYDKMRYAFAILRELGVDDLRASELERLFVSDLAAYADVPSAAKNLQAQYQKSRKHKTI